MSSLAGALVPWNTDDKALKQDAPQDEEMEDLFGNEDAEESKAQEYEEEDAPPEITVEVREALVEFPNVPVPKSSNGDNWVIRMPNFVKVDSKPFHHETYMGPEQEEDEAQQAETLREKSMSIKLKVENTVRWRWTKDAEDRDRRQSNSRIIRWSDGSLSLRLGKELFDINQSIDTSGGKSFGASQSQPTSAGAGAGKSQGLTYIVAQHKRSQVLQSEALVTGYMTLRPTGMQSETHRMLVRAVGQKHNKVARLRMAPDPTMDPEREKMELMKLNARKSKRKADSEEGGRQRRSSRKSRGASVWSDDEDDAGAVYASDEDEDEGAGGSSGRRSKHHRPPTAEEDKKDADYQRDGFVVDTDDEEGSDAGGTGKRRHQDDELDRMDAQINELHTTKRRRGSADSKEEASREDADEVMDVESEEEEDPDEHRVRPLGRTGRTGGSSRRLQIEEEEEEE
ncbi:Leo1-like protein-domain-containing protein [Mycena rosella]|uniref:Leo1-like protein-domain-containing protein n=1 Tax=Mycena rosella TaxID=1033263 RepID=A0AAD7DMA2_MYCRO|nr:Leo1-like protein-domain-containing protein [Mycena rosella]